MRQVQREQLDHGRIQLLGPECTLNVGASPTRATFRPARAPNPEGERRCTSGSGQAFASSAQSLLRPAQGLPGSSQGPRRSYAMAAGRVLLAGGERASSICSRAAHPDELRAGLCTISFSKTKRVLKMRNRPVPGDSLSEQVMHSGSRTKPSAQPPWEACHPGRKATDQL